MNRLDEIRERLTQVRSGSFDWNLEDMAREYDRDVTLLLQLASAALAYEEATQIPDGVQRAEQALFSALAPLREPA